MLRGLLPILSFLALTFAGCLGAVPATPSTGAAEQSALSFEKIRADIAGLPCQVPSVPATSSSENMKVIMDDPLNEVGPTHSHAEYDLHGDLLLDAIYSGKGFTLADIRDPLEPKQLGYFLDPNPSRPGRGSDETLDVKFSDDGMNAFVGYSDSVGVVDITDPTAPKLVQTQENPTGYVAQAHMMQDAKIGDHEYLFVFPSISGTNVVVHELSGRGPTAKLTYVTQYLYKSPDTPTGQPVAPHDGYVMWDPVLQHNLLYLANGFYGVQVLNVDDPAHPVTITTIAANADGTPTGNLPNMYHTVQAAWIDGKRILATSSEVGYNSLKVWDATDLKTPKFLGQWVFDKQNPTNMEHNIQIVNGTLFEAHYGQGLFGFDLRSYTKAPTPELKPVFHVQPADGGSWWDVVVRKGLAYVSDTPQGLHVVAYGCFTPGDETLTSTG